MEANMKTEQMVKTGGALSVLNDITERVRYYARRGILDWLELGKALTEAKALVEPGKWLDYVSANAGMGKRMCQNCMQAYAKFGTGNPDIANLSLSQVIPVLPASKEEIGKLMEENDVSAMSTREIREAVRKTQDEERQKAREAVAAEQESSQRMLAREREKNQQAMREQQEQAERYREKCVTEAVAEKEKALEALRAELEETRSIAGDLRKAAEEAESRAKDATEAAIEGVRDTSALNDKLRKEADSLRRELHDKDAVIQELQEQYDAMQQDYLDAQSAIAKGDAERSTADILSAEAVGDAVRIFIGQVGRVPYMHGSFAEMDHPQREEYRMNILQVKEWAEKSLAALETVLTEGGVF